MINDIYPHLPYLSATGYQDKQCMGKPAPLCSMTPSKAFHQLIPHTIALAPQPNNTFDEEQPDNLHPSPGYLTTDRPEPDPYTQYQYPTQTTAAPPS